MAWLRKKLHVSMGRVPAWVAAITAILLVALILGILSRVLDGTSSQRAFNSPITTIATAASATAEPTSQPLSADVILARSRSANYKDMSGSETVLYGDGGSTKATIVLTLNPTRSEEVDSQFAAEGTLIERDDVIKDGARRYQHTISYRTIPPTDEGWKLDPQPLPDPRPLNVLLLDPFTRAATLIGTETIDGVSVYHLQVQLGATSKQEVWIRSDNFYFVQWKATDSFSQALITMTTWDSGLSIKVPSV